LEDAILRIAEKKRHGIARITPIPTHFHAAIRPSVHESPLDIVYCYQNNLAHMAKLGAIWREGYFVGTFGEYSMAGVRKHL
jgi:REP element-mobilizing transposase RayT